MYKLCLFVVLLFTPNFSFSATLPSGYTRLEYIESNGTQYIDTEIILSDYTNPKIVFTGKLASKIDNGNFMLGTYNNNPQHIFFINHSRISYDYDNFGQKRFDFSDQDYILDKHTYYCKYTQNGSDKKFSLGIDSENYTQEDTYTDLPTVYSLYLFGRNTAGTLQLSKTVIYGFKFYDGSTLVYNFIPAKRDNDGMVGMYDLVHGVFYTNANTSTAYTQLESLSNSSTSQYIQDDTLTSLDSGTIEIKVGNCLNKEYRFVGWGSQTDVYVVDAAIAVSANGSIYALSYGGEHHWFGADANVNDINIIKYKFEPDLQEVRINGILSNTSNQPAITNHNYPFRMFRASVNYSSHCTIYYCKVYDGSGNLLREYIPVKDSNNVLGMYETQTGRFLTNAGSGTFTAGSNVGTYIPNFIAGPEVNSCDASLNILNEEMCVETTAPVWPYLTAWYNNNTYYIKLSENDYPIHSGSSHKLQIITDGKTYNAHDESVE